MIRLAGLVDLKSVGLSKPHINEEAPEIPQDNIQGYETPPGDGGQESGMAKADLMAIQKKAADLFNMIGDGEGLEGWVQEKISLAADYINAVHSHMDYEKNKANTIGHGEGTPADSPMGMAPADNGYATNEAFSLSEWMKEKGYLRAGEEETEEVVEGEVKSLNKAKKAAYMTQVGQDAHPAYNRRPDQDPVWGGHGKGKDNLIRGRNQTNKVDGRPPKRHTLQKLSSPTKHPDAVAAADAARNKKITNPVTGKEIQASTALKDKSHPAYNAAKAATSK